MGDSPMHCVFKIGHQPHKTNRKKYGQPYLALYYADRRTFVYPGLHLWVVKRNVRVLPLPKRKWGK